MSTTLKPIRGIRLNKSHPLARGLVGYWLLNEGTGNKVFDLSENGNTGTSSGAIWVPGKHGSAQQYDGDDDYTNCGSKTILNCNGDEITVVASLRQKPGSTIAGYDIILARVSSSGHGYRLWTRDSSSFRYYWNIKAPAGGGETYINSTTEISSVNFQHVAGVCKASSYFKLYVNGIEEASDLTLSHGWQDFPPLYIGCMTGIPIQRFFPMDIEYISIYNRALCASEIAQLYREPFAMFSYPISPKLMHTPTTNVVNMTGSASAQASAAGKLTFIGEPPGVLPQKMWLKEALFAGMTANAFKLGTTLSLGWFWMRLGGCSALYRGPEMNQIDFESILTVAEQDAGYISPPGYVPHNSNSTCFYVVRRFNQCGDQEHTLAAAAKLSIDANGGLAEPQPNNVFSSRVESVNGNKIRLTWFYSTLEQQSAPTCFNIYYDNLSGQIDYENPIATVRYEGRKFYSYESDPLTAGRYLFAIRAKDLDGTENSSPALLRIHLQAGNPDAIDVLSIEAV